jgi:hypothetical protein
MVILADERGDVLPYLAARLRRDAGLFPALADHRLQEGLPFLHFAADAVQLASLPRRPRLLD